MQQLSVGRLLRKLSFAKGFGNAECVFGGEDADMAGFVVALVPGRRESIASLGIASFRVILCENRSDEWLGV